MYHDKYNYHLETEYSFINISIKNKLFLQLLTRNRDKLGLVLNPRDGLEERDDTSSFSPPFK